MTYELHPLCTLFPRITGAEFESLKADIAAHGLRQPIVLHEEFILDGGNRYRACLELGIEPETVEFSGGNLVSYVLSVNMHRRHLSPGQQAAIVASATDWGMAQVSGSNQHATKSGGATLPDLPLSTLASRVAQSGASERTQKMADAVAKKSPELAKQVAQGEISLPKAHKQITPQLNADEAIPNTPVSDGLEEDDFAPDFAKELEAAAEEIKRLNRIIEDITKDDLAKEVRDWSLKFDQLCGRNAQLNTTCNEATTQARRNGELLTKIRKALGVETNAQILPALNK